MLIAKKYALICFKCFSQQFGLRFVSYKTYGFKEKNFHDLIIAYFYN